MFKKLFCLFLCVFTFFTCVKSELKASEDVINFKDLIVVNNQKVDLNIDGFVLIESNFVAHTVGEYECIYKKINSETLYKRVVKVVSEDVLKEGLICEKEIFNFDDYDEIKDVVYEDNTYYFITCTNGYEVHKFDGNKIYNSPYLVSKELGSITKIVYDDGLIYGIGHKVNNGTSQDVMVFKLDEDLNIEDVVFFKGSNLDYATSICFDSQNLYITGYTHSNDLDFKHSKNSIDSYIIKVDKNDFTNNLVKVFSQEGNDYFHKVCEGDYLYILAKQAKNSFQETTVLKLDKNLNLVNEFSLPFVHHESVVDFVYDDGILNYLSTYVENSKHYGVHYKISNNGVKYDIIDNLKSGKINKNSLFYYDENKVIYKGENTLKSNWLNNQNVIFLNDNLVAFTNKNNISIRRFNNLLINDYKLYVDDNLYHPSLDKSVSNYNENVFGKYTYFTFYETPIFDFQSMVTIDVPFKTNIENHNVYNVGLKLFFNGEGYLNNTLIENEYVIDQIGDYVLEIKGLNDKVKVSFKVVDLRTEIASNYVPINELSFNNLKSFVNDDLNINIQKDLTITSDELPNLWGILIPVSALIISLTSIICLRRRLK